MHLFFVILELIVIVIHAVLDLFHARWNLSVKHLTRFTLIILKCKLGLPNLVFSLLDLLIQFWKLVQDMVDQRLGHRPWLLSDLAISLQMILVNLLYFLRKELLYALCFFLYLLLDLLNIFINQCLGLIKCLYLIEFHFCSGYLAVYFVDLSLEFGFYYVDLSIDLIPHVLLATSNL